jgi:hypothetical protein
MPKITSYPRCNSLFLKIAVTVTMSFLLSPNVSFAYDTGATPTDPLNIPFDCGEITYGKPVHQFISSVL